MSILLIEASWTLAQHKKILCQHRSSVTWNTEITSLAEGPKWRDWGVIWEEYGGIRRSWCMPYPNPLQITDTSAILGKKNTPKIELCINRNLSHTTNTAKYLITINYYLFYFLYKLLVNFSLKSNGLHWCIRLRPLALGTTRHSGCPEAEGGAKSPCALATCLVATWPGAAPTRCPSLTAPRMVLGQMGCLESTPSMCLHTHFLCACWGRSLREVLVGAPDGWLACCGAVPTCA